MKSEQEMHEMWDVSVGRHGVTRRRFLRTSVLAASALGCGGLTRTIAARAGTLRRQGKACILLWMQGGPSQLETWDPKPGHTNGGETKAIATDVPGIRIADNLPEVARHASKLCVLRSMTSKEASHPRATFLMRTGYLPQASVKYPALGSHVAYHLSDDEFDLPSFVRIGRSTPGLAKGGFLGVDYDPFIISSATRKPDNTEAGVAPDRFRRRLALAGDLERTFAEQGGRELVESHRKVYRQASQMVLSDRMEAFDIEREPGSMRDAYGDGETAMACLLARRLVETGVPFVEVSVGNWDTHDDNFNRTRQLCERLDRPMATLLADLADRGLLDRTLVIWAGEFGRTPRINARSGRDHYPRAYSAVLAGCGVRGGQVIGATDAGGVEITDRPIRVSDFFRTVYHALGIDADHEYMSNIGRPIKVADEGSVVEEVFTG